MDKFTVEKIGKHFLVIYTEVEPNVQPKLDTFGNVVANFVTNRGEAKTTKKVFSSTKELIKFIEKF